MGGGLATRSGLELALADAIAVTLEDGDVGVMSEAVDECDDAGGIREDGVPACEDEVGGDDG